MLINILLRIYIFSNCYREDHIGKYLIIEQVAEKLGVSSQAWRRWDKSEK